MSDTTITVRSWPLFSRRRTLLGELCHIFERLLIQAYIGAAPAGRPGLILFVQTFDDLANFNPHLHVLAADGVFRMDGVFVALPAVPVKLLEQGFRCEVLTLLVAEHLKSDYIHGVLCAELSITAVTGSWGRDLAV